MFANFRSGLVRSLASCLVLNFIGSSALAGLQQYWDFEDASTSTTLINQAAGGNVGQLYEYATVATTPANFYSPDKPAALAHSNQSLNLMGPSSQGWANLGSFDLNNRLTFSAWVNVTDAEPPGRPFTQVTPHYTGDPEKPLTAGIFFSGRFNLLDNSGNVWNQMSSTPLGATGWRHWAIVYDPDGFSEGVATGTFYLDGVEQSTRKTAFNFEPEISEFGLGLPFFYKEPGFTPSSVFEAGALYTGAFFNGKVDDLAIFDDMLSPAQIAQLAAGADPASVQPPSLHGDFNGDDVVDGADLEQWKGDFGINGDSDANGDGNSDGADFLIWQQQLGAGASTVAGAAVPEASSLTLALSALLVGFVRSSRRFIP